MTLLRSVTPTPLSSRSIRDIARTLRTGTGLALALLCLSAVPLATPAAAQDAFITTWETSDDVTIPTNGDDVSDYDFTIDWGDGTTEEVSGNDPDPTHTYNSSGTYTIEITGTFPRFWYEQRPEGVLQSIEQWGDIQWESMAEAFKRADQLTYNATDTPDLSDVESMDSMFKNASAFNGAIGDWDVSNVTEMEGLFNGTDFNQPIGDWDVSNVTDMSAMFNGTPFNQPIGDWDVSNVTDMSDMFRSSDFNQPIGQWNVSNVTDMTAMFQGSDFDQDIGEWDVSNVTSFNSFSGRFLGSSVLSTANYDALLIGWSRLDLQDGLTLTADFQQYTQAAADARQSIIDDHGWSINDDGLTSGASVTLTGGSSYDPAVATPGTDANPVGRFGVQADSSGSKLDRMVLTLDGSNEGVASVELWRSNDDAFDAGQDSLLAAADTLDPTTPTPNTLTVGGVDLAAPTSQVFVFVVVDLTASAGGDVQVSAQDSSDVMTAGGTLTNDAGSFPLAFSSDATPLPVELAGFDAQVDGETVRLAWTTATETNNAGFRVQRRVGTEGRSGAWEQVGRVDGHGTTTEVRSYRFTDADLPYDAEVLTYRLKQVDTDGSASFSETVTVRRGVTDVQLLGTAPNPARGQTTVRYALPEKQPFTLRLYDVLGRQVRTVSSEKKEGRYAQALDVRGLPSGVYFLRLRSEGTIKTQKLTIVR